MPGRGTRRIQLWLLLLSSSTFLYRSLEKGNETHKQIDRDFHPHPHLNQSVDQFNVLDILDQILSKQNQIWDQSRFSLNRSDNKIYFAHLLLLKTQGEWKEKVIGAGTLTKDFSRKSYFIQIFDVQQRQKVNLNIFKDEHYPVKSLAFGCVLPCARRRQPLIAQKA